MAEPLTPTGLTLEEALRLQTTTDQTRPQEGQFFVTSEDIRTGDVANLFRIQGGQVQAFNPLDILTEQEKASAGDTGTQRAIAIQRLKARGIDVSQLPQVQTTGELGLPVVGGQLGSVLGAQPTTTATQPTTAQQQIDILAGVTAPLGSPERTQQLLDAIQKTRSLFTGTPAEVVSPSTAPATPTTPAAPTTAAPAISSVQDLTTNTAISALEAKIADQSAKIAAGIAAGGATAILEEQFTRFGVAEEISLLNEFNAQILEQQQLLRDIPEDIRATTQDLGVTKDQLRRLVLQATEGPLKTLARLMEQRGAAQDKINQTLKFVGLFADAAMQDQAARIEAAKFDLETNKDLLDRLDDRQADVLKLALDERADKLQLANIALSNNAPKSVVDAINNADSIVDAQSILAQSGFGISVLDRQRLEGTDTETQQSAFTRAENLFIQNPSQTEDEFVNAVRSQLVNAKGNPIISISDAKRIYQEQLAKDPERIERNLTITAEDLLATHFKTKFFSTRTGELNDAKKKAKEQIDLFTVNGKIDIDGTEYDSEKLKSQIDSITDAERIIKLQEFQ